MSFLSLSLSLWLSRPHITSWMIHNESNAYFIFLDTYLFWYSFLCHFCSFHRKIESEVNKCGKEASIAGSNGLRSLTYNNPQHADHLLEWKQMVARVEHSKNQFNSIQFQIRYHSVYTRQSTKNQRRTRPFNWEVVVQLNRAITYLNWIKLTWISLPEICIGVYLHCDQFILKRTSTET